MADLVTSQELKDYLEIGDDTVDTLIADLIVNGSKAIRSYCDRAFAADTARVELHDGGQLNLIVNEPDINSITSIVDVDSYGDTVTAGSFATGTTYTIITAGTTDFTAIGATDSNPGTVFTATGAGTGTGTAGKHEDEDTEDYGYEIGRMIYRKSGAVWAKGRQRWRVTYSGGSDTIPDDVKQACLEWCAMRFDTKDMSVTNVTLGGEGSARVLSNGMSESIQQLLSSYRVNQGRF